MRPAASHRDGLQESFAPPVQRLLDAAGGVEGPFPSHDGDASAEPGSSALMDKIYRRQRHIYDASRKFYLLGRDELISSLCPPEGGRVLEIACGTGRNLVKLARTYPLAACYGFDISAEMLHTAQRSIERADLVRRIRLAQGDATNFDPQTLFGQPCFDRIIISYALSMIPPWREALRHAAGYLAPGGSLHLVDFGDQAGLPSAFRNALNRWLAAFHVTPRLTLEAEIAGVAGELGLSSRSTRRYRGYAVHGALERPRA